MNYFLHLADSNLIMSQRLAEWTGHGPALEQDIALTNISLDLLGQARHWYQHAATLSEKNTDEDELAYLRDAIDYKNHTLCELPNLNWGHSIIKLYYFVQHQHLLMKQMALSAEAEVSAISIKSLKELEYHIRWSREWIIRLGDGTEESHIKMQDAVDVLAPYLKGLFQTINNQPTIVDLAEIRIKWLNAVKETFEEATLNFSMHENSVMGYGHDGNHTEHLGYILAEMQFLQRAYPNSEW